MFISYKTRFFPEKSRALEQVDQGKGQFFTLGHQEPAAPEATAKLIFMSS
jgi:hypothetical protein